MTISINKRNEIISLFAGDLTIQECASKMEVSVGTVYNIWTASFGTAACKSRRSRLMSGENHPNWNGGFTYTSKGYRLIYAPDWYEGYKDDAGRSPEHMVKWCEYNNVTKVPDGHIVHHRNEDKLDVSPDNLELLSKSEHTATHAARRERDYNGKFL